MPWKEVIIPVRTQEGVVEGTYEECPLGKFKVNRDSGGPGFYNGDPVEACLRCNFADLSEKDHKEACKCPPDMTQEEYETLKKGYLEEASTPTRTGFLEYVERARA